MKRLYLVTALVLLTCMSNAYRRDDFATVFIGGLDSIYGQPNAIANAIRAAYPDIPFVELKIGDGSQAATHTGLYRQLDQIYNFALNTPALNGKHVILIGGSQGGLLAQAFVEMYGHRLPFTIEALMTIASPLAGEYGLPDGWESIVDNVVWHGDSILLQQILSLLGIRDQLVTYDDGYSLPLEEAVTRAGDSRDILDPLRAFVAQLAKDLIRNNIGLFWILLYNPIAQDIVSFACYWRDPMEYGPYMLGNTFLPYINNEKQHGSYERYRSNIALLNRIVFFWAGQDTVIKPPRSGQKCTYKWGSTSVMDSGFRDTTQYQQNPLNLGIMYDNGRLFIEYLPNDGHGCESLDARNRALQHFNTIVNQPAPSEIFDAVNANNLTLIQSMVAANPAIIFIKDGFNYMPIHYAGNRLAIAQYLFAQYLAQGKPLDIERQGTLAYNAAGCGSVEVLRWIIEDLFYDLGSIRSLLVGIASQNGQGAILAYLNSARQTTLPQAIVQNNGALVTQMLNTNPLLITLRDASQMLPIYYAGNRPAMAQQLFALHLQYAPLTLDDIGTLLYYACGAASLETVKWIIEDLYFDATAMQQRLLGISWSGDVINYLQTSFAQSRPTIFAAVQQNNLPLVTYIVGKNPANAEQVEQGGMLPILYAGNKLAIAQYLYVVHQQLGRPLSTATLNSLLYFAFGSGSLEVAQWMIEQLNFDPRPTKDSLIAIARTNGQLHMVEYLASMGIS